MLPACFCLWVCIIWPSLKVWSTPIYHDWRRRRSSSLIRRVVYKRLSWSCRWFKSKGSCCLDSSINVALEVNKSNMILFQIREGDDETYLWRSQKMPAESTLPVTQIRDRPGCHMLPKWTFLKYYERPIFQSKSTFISFWVFATSCLVPPNTPKPVHTPVVGNPQFMIK